MNDNVRFYPIGWNVSKIDWFKLYSTDKDDHVTRGNFISILWKYFGPWLIIDHCLYLPWPVYIKICHKRKHCTFGCWLMTLFAKVHNQWFSGVNSQCEYHTPLITMCNVDDICWFAKVQKLGLTDWLHLKLYVVQCIVSLTLPLR